MKTKILADFKSALCTLILESKFGDNLYQVYFNHVRHVFILVQFCTVNEGKLRNICAHIMLIICAHMLCIRCSESISKSQLKMSSQYET